MAAARKGPTGRKGLDYVPDKAARQRLKRGRASPPRDGPGHALRNTQKRF